jgi:hypothetical protein
MSHWLQTDLTFEPEEHVYCWKGVPRRSVSQVMESVGILDKETGFYNPVGYGKFAKRFDSAREFGNTFHKIAPAIVQNKPVRYPAEMDPWIVQLREYLRSNPLQPLIDINGVPIIEYPMYSVKYGYCGTPDLVAYNSKFEVCVIDWKTSAAHEKHYNYQTAAYEQLVREVHNVKTKIRRITLRITDKENDPVDRSGQPIDWIKFQSMLNILN